MTTVYTVPTNPADPEAAALELIVRVPSDILGHDSPPRDALQDFVSLLDAENCFIGMSWHDARHAATVSIYDTPRRARPARNSSNSSTTTCPPWSRPANPPPPSTCAAQSWRKWPANSAAPPPS
jgi:hypothetical protein